MCDALFAYDVEWGNLFTSKGSYLPFFVLA